MENASAHDDMGGQRSETLYAIDLGATQDFDAACGEIQVRTLSPRRHELIRRDNGILVSLPDSIGPDSGATNRQASI